MGQLEQQLAAFATYARGLRGDEKSEAQIFLERFFQAFGWSGLQEAGAQLETRVPIKLPGRKTSPFADLVWRSELPHRAGCLIEMKSRGAIPTDHYRQAFEYWQHIVPRRSRYTLICNFDEICIYDFDLQLYEPVDRIPIKDLPKRHPALAFLYPEPKKPQFGNDRVAVTREAADQFAAVFNHLTDRKVDRAQAQRFLLQCVVCMFAEDIDLLPRGFFTELLDECVSGSATTFDLFGELFRWMNSPKPAKGGRFKAVPYFNGSLFATVDPIDLSLDELKLLRAASGENDWSKVQPAIFGTLFQSSMDKGERHALGAHYTSEADIQRVVLPTLVRPWRERLTEAKTREELIAVRTALEKFRVLDPACGSGNFLYVAYRELLRLEMDIVQRLHLEFPSARRGKTTVIAASFVSIRQFFGIDLSEFATELAKVVLVLANKLAYDEITTTVGAQQLGFDLENPLPLENLDENIQCADAIFCEWPKVDAIIGNPPYQSKNKMQQEFGAKYVQRLRREFPDVPGRADYCVYWFRRAHDALPQGKRAGLVGTNTIRQNYSREGSLDYIVQNGGTITEAVSSQVWSGEAAVHVSVVNWLKGPQKGKKLLSWQNGDHVDSPWEKVLVDEINSALSPRIDVTSAAPLRANKESRACYQGQTHGHEGFLLDPDEARALIVKSPKNRDVLFPYLIGEDLLGREDRSPSRWAIDLHPRGLHEASVYREAFAHVRATILPDRQKAADEEVDRNAEATHENPEAKVNRHHEKFLNQWWLFSWPRPELIRIIGAIPRYIACARVIKRPIFDFISSAIRPGDALQIFPLADDYSFGILQSSVHWQWFTERCSTLTRRFRYTSDTVFDSFPWPQAPTANEVKRVAEVARELRATRAKLMRANGLTLRALYRQLETPGKSALRDAQDTLDSAVRAAYDMPSSANVLAFLLGLNHSLRDIEASGKSIVGPGLPTVARAVPGLVSKDCVPAPAL